MFDVFKCTRPAFVRRRIEFLDFADKMSARRARQPPSQMLWRAKGCLMRADRSLMIWGNAAIDQFRFYLDSGACEFRFSKIELLVPTE
jgi:hypothetical protein